jgi:hypothetical protein
MLERHDSRRVENGGPLKTQLLTSSLAFRCFIVLFLTIAPSGRVAQALTDTDSDGMDDGWEVTHFGNLSATSTGDSDSDGMTNGEEYLHGFVPTVNDAFDDSDGDRYPNVFEVRSGSDPGFRGSKPEIRRTASRPDRIPRASPSDG